MATVGLITKYGSDLSIKAQNEKGFFILPKSFAVSETAGPWKTDRTVDENPPAWYKAEISSAKQVGDNAIEIVCTIPPGASPINREFREIQVFCEDTEGNEFFYGFGQPGNPPSQVVPIPWAKSDILEIRLQFIIAPLDAEHVFEFIYSQAQEISDHNLNKNSHPEILKLLQRAGITMFKTDNNLGGQWVDMYPSFNTEELKHGDWVYLDDDTYYKKALADRTKKQKAPGMLDLSLDKPRVIFGGVVQVGIDLPQGETLYLSKDEPGKVTSDKSPRPLGTSMGNNKFIISAGISSGGDTNVVLTESDYLTSAGDVVDVWFPNNKDVINIILPLDVIHGDEVIVRDPGQAVSLGGKTIVVSGNTRGIDNVSAITEEKFMIDVPGAVVKFIYNQKSNSWMIDLGGKSTPNYNRSLNIYYWDLEGTGNSEISFGQKASMAQCPNNTNPYLYLVQVGDKALTPPDYSIIPDRNIISFKEAPEIGAKILIRYVGYGSSIDGCSVGMIATYVKGDVPLGWVVCNGQMFDPEVYPDLYRKLGENYVPDLNSDPESFLLWWIKAYDNVPQSGYMNSTLGVPVGFEAMWPGTTAPDGWIDESFDNGLLSRDTYPSLWNFAQNSGNIISEEDWQIEKSMYGSVGKFSMGDGSTTFRVPFKQKVYDRAIGEDELVGTYLKGTAVAGQPTSGSNVLYNIQNTNTDVSEFPEKVGGDVLNSELYSGVKAVQVAGVASTVALNLNSIAVRPNSVLRMPIIKAFDTNINASYLNVESALEDMRQALALARQSVYEELIEGQVWKLPNGLIVQMFTISNPASYAENALINVTLPMAFPNEILSLQGTVENNVETAVVRVLSLSRKSGDLALSTIGVKFNAAGATAGSLKANIIAIGR